MKKVFRLARAEYSKLFLRPSIFILTTILIVGLVLSFMLFKPSKNINKIEFEGNSVASIYQDFTSSSGNGAVSNLHPGVVEIFQTSSAQLSDGKSWK